MLAKICQTILFILITGWIMSTGATNNGLAAGMVAAFIVFVVTATWVKAIDLVAAVRRRVRSIGKASAPSPLPGPPPRAAFQAPKQRDCVDR